MAKYEKLGALWVRELASGMVIYSGSVTIDGKITKITLFPNDKGDNPKRPDFNIVLDTYVPKPRVEQPEPAEDAEESPAPDKDDSIPF